MTPLEYCRQKAAASGSSFYYSFLFLPPDKRDAIMAFYAFCREVDDVVDEVSDPQLARIKLAWWRTEIDRLFANNKDDPATHPVALALAQTQAVTQVRSAQLMEIIAGMEMDLNQTRYPDWEALRVYCHRVAGVVGEVSAQIFGVADPATAQDTRDYANTLGLALQMTNIIRDVGDDARRGRVYLPEDAMARHGITREDVLARKAPPAFAALMQEQAAQARTLYRNAAQKLAAVNVRHQRAGLIMGRIYRALLEEIAADNFPVLNQRTALTPLTKFWLAWKSWVFPRSAVAALKK
jgi:15-cis-phytoene synthase